MIASNEDFQDIYIKYRKFSAGVAYKMIKDKAMAEDICQDVFYKLYTTNIEIDLSNERKLHALILKATINMTKDYLKKAYAKWESCELDDADWKEIEDRRNNPEARMLYLEEREYRNQVLECLRKENPMNYEILMKTKVLGIPPDFVAEEYGITRNNVNNRILRTKRWLDEELLRAYGKKFS